MSGHSKWATIKRAKAVNDAKRGNLFTKLANLITVAAKQGGGDVDTNFKLRLAIEKAKAANMPKDNIERAIKRGTGELTDKIIEELTYGALLPGQVAVIIKCLSDNKNRTVTEVKTAVVKNGGQITDLNAVSWQFDQKGVIKINKNILTNKNHEEIEMIIIDSGADDYEEDAEEIIIYTQPSDLKSVQDNLQANGLPASSADLEMVAKSKKEVDDETLNKVIRVLEALDALDDVNNYYTNLK